MNRTGNAKGRDDLVHLLRQVHRTETRKVTEKVAVTEVQKAHRNLLIQVRQKKSNQATLYKLQERKLPKGNLM